MSVTFSYLVEEKHPSGLELLVFFDFINFFLKTLTKNIIYWALLHFRTPLFLLMILVQNFMLIKNHIETWVWKSTETKLFTSKVLQNLEVTMKKRHGFNTTILSPSWKIDKLKNNITKITQQ